MAVEIERKFLVTGEAWRAQASPHRITQGFLCRDPDRVVRVRLQDEEAFMTIKGRAKGISRSEIEFSIPSEHAEDLLAMCLPTVIEKTRHEVEWAGHTWEVDEFHGSNAGLVVAELELASEDAEFDRPPWLGTEVSHDRRYTNVHLSEHPFSTWPAA
jgi:adenylate cyclase